MRKRILVVADDRPLRISRVSLLESEGYRVDSVSSDDEAISLLETQAFDLILLGRNSYLDRKNIDQRLREKFPDLLTLKIVHDHDADFYASRETDAEPAHVLQALKDMLGDGVRLVPPRLFSDD
jgi:DNA-binding NtrC family response regulator